MIIEPNTKLSYKDGKRRITVWFHNRTDKGIFFSVNIKQASRSFSGGDGYYSSEMINPIHDENEGTADYVNAAIAANS